MRAGPPQRNWKHQPDAELDQPNPDQNQWYTILEASGGVRVYAVRTRICTTDETLELRLTIDGVIYEGSEVFMADAWFTWSIAFEAKVMGAVMGGIMIFFNSFVEGHNLKIELRKTTAAGAGNLQATAYWARKA